MRAVELPYSGRYAVAPALALLEAHTIPGLERHDGPRHARLIMGAGSPIAVEVELLEDRVRVSMDSAGTDDATAILAAVRGWLATEKDPAEAERELSRDPLLSPLIAERPGLRVLGHIDGFEAAVLTVLGQQVSLAAARTFGGRLVREYGTDGPADLRIFPTPEALSSAPLEELRAAVGLTMARARTVQALATACLAGLLISAEGDHASIRAGLLSVPGIGPWTVEYLAVRALLDPDAYPSGDLVLKRALGARTTAEAARIAESWRPHRALALFHLWSHAVY